MNKLLKLFDDIVSQVLNDVFVIYISTDVLGCPLSIPICVSVTSMQKLVHPSGKIAVAEGAAAM